MKEIRVAMIGCGAVAERAHLPALSGLAGARLALLVDTNEGRLARLSARFGGAPVARDWTGAAGEFDAAVVALPHHLHEPVCCALLAAGKHVLVEKPLALTGRAAEAMVEAARRSGAQLAVGLQRRYQWSFRFLRDLLERGGFGPVRSFDFAEGNIYEWPVASDFFFRRESAGGGVLVDTGAHTLDLALWLLGPHAEVDYADDAEGGVEAECRLELRLQSGARGIIELSRLRRMRNSLVIRWDQAAIEADFYGNRVRLEGRAEGLTGEVARFGATGRQYYPDLMTEQIGQWIAALAAGRPVAVPGSAALPSIRLIEECYARRRPWAQGWSEIIAGHR